MSTRHAGQISRRVDRWAAHAEEAHLTGTALDRLKGWQRLVVLRWAQLRGWISGERSRSGTGRAHA